MNESERRMEHVGTRLKAFSLGIVKCFNVLHIQRSQDESRVVECIVCKTVKELTEWN
jgi:hypothetical protein